ncbi:MAG: ribonuclease P protein component [Verrucomicrobia bacterium TMED175]|nr:MAG: ribonuclease P protein component [Verrucomicrobia bacterium TMED175]
MRLLTKEDFWQVKRSKLKVRTPFFWGQAIHCTKNKAVRIGIITTRKLGDAHIRNRARRMVRELFRRNFPKIQSTVSMIVLPRKEMFDQEFKTLETEFISFLDKLSVLK